MSAIRPAMRRAVMLLVLVALLAVLALPGLAQRLRAAVDNGVTGATEPRRALSLTPSVSVLPPPDVNGDGAVTAVDALCLQRAIAALPSTADCTLPLSRSDVNGDGVTDAVDVLCVLRYVANLPSPPACPLSPAAASP